MAADSVPRGSRYFLGLLIGCALLSLAAVNAGETAAPPQATSLVSSPAPVSVYVIDGDTISLNDGRPNVRLVGFNAPETGSRARCAAARHM